MSIAARMGTALLRGLAWLLIVRGQSSGYELWTWLEDRRLHRRELRKHQIGGG